MKNKTSKSTQKQSKIVKKCKNKKNRRRRSLKTRAKKFGGSLSENEKSLDELYQKLQKLDDDNIHTNINAEITAKRKKDKLDEEIETLEEQIRKHEADRNIYFNKQLNNITRSGIENAIKRSKPGYTKSARWIATTTVLLLGIGGVIAVRARK